MSRRQTRSRQLRRRPSRVVPASVTAAVLTAAGVLAVLIAAARLLEDRWPGAVTGPAGAVAALRWGSPTVITTAAVLAALGLVLLIAGLKPGGFSAAPVAAPGPGSAEETDFVLSTRGLVRLAAGRADRVDGVEKVSASASGRRVHLAVVTTSEQTGQIAAQVRDGVTETLAAAGVRPVPRVTAHVSTKGL